MNAIKSILVPVDFSDLAAESYQYALRLADELSASVHLIYSITTPPGITTHPDFFQHIAEEWYESAEANLQLFQEEGIAQSSLSKLPTVNNFISIADLNKSIKAYCKEQQIDLILIGTHGVRDAWDRLFGTNVISLVEKIDTPVLILPPGTKYRPFKSICFATEFRDRDLKKATDLLQAMYPFLPQMHFVHVMDPAAAEPKEGIGFFRRAFERPQQRMQASYTTITNQDVTDGIFAYLETHQHDLLVMVKPNRKWWNRLVSHSETLESTGIATLPLLILEDKV